MSEPNSGQWGKQDSGGSANPSVAHAADGEGPTVEAEPSRGPSYSGATHVASHALASGLVQPFTELKETMSRITDQIAIQQDKIYKTLSSIKLPDPKAINMPLSAFTASLAQPFTELQETMSRITDQIAIQQDNIYKTLSSIKLPDPKAINMPLSAFTAGLAQPTTELKERSEIIESEHQEDCTDIINQIQQDIGDIKAAIEKPHSPSKLDLTRKLVVKAVTLAMVIIELADTLWGYSDITIINVWEICTQYVVL